MTFRSRLLTQIPLDVSPRTLPGSENFLKYRKEIHGLAEYRYNFWRGFDRFIISASERLISINDRTFNATIETLAHLVRSTYRDIQENIANRHPRVYRQVRAGANIAVIAVPREIPLSAPYRENSGVPIIRQILLHPPLILEPPMSKHTGCFKKIGENPLTQMEFPERE